MTPIIVGLSGSQVTPDERAALQRVAPAGFILFARNIVDPVQLRALTDDLRDASGRDDLPILTDQEGGAVARLRPPHWPATLAAARFAAAYDRAPMTAIRAMRAQGQAVGRMLAAGGITMNAAPVLDLAWPGATPALAQRCLGATPMVVAALGRAMLEGLAAGGVTGIVKHWPGHGRATSDPHQALPVVDADEGALAADLSPFHTLAGSAKAGMTAHVLYPVWDIARPATLSPLIVQRVIRERLGFDGLLLSDDLHMGALDGDLPARAQGAVAAGCDLALCCAATPEQWTMLAERLPPVGSATMRRLAAAMPPAGQGEVAALIAERDALLAAA